MNVWKELIDAQNMQNVRTLLETIHVFAQRVSPEMASLVMVGNTVGVIENLGY